MTNSNSRKVFYSRLARKEEKRNLRKAILFSLLTIVLLLGLIFFGIPSLTGLAVLVSELRGTSVTIEQNDTLPPPPPRFNSLPEYTKESSLSISGFSEPSSTVEIFLNGSSAGTVVSTAEGTFTFSKVSLPSRENEIYTIATDEAGNKSQPTPRFMIIFDNTAPKLEITQPQDGTTLAGERKRKIRIEGQTEENVSLTINERLIILASEGKFSTDYTLSDGENHLKVIAIDPAGNQTEKELKLTFNP